MTATIDILCGECGEPIRLGLIADHCAICGEPIHRRCSEVHHRKCDDLACTEHYERMREQAP